VDWYAAGLAMVAATVAATAHSVMSTSREMFERMKPLN
jgi:hypothetical protein